MRRAALAVLVFVAAMAPRGARAAPPGDWYGDRTLFADAASIGVALASKYDADGLRLVMPDRPTLRLEAVAGVGYLLGAPVVHWARANVARGFGSLTLRLAIPAAAGLLTLASVGQDGSGRRAPPPIVLAGAGAGAAGAILLDAVFLARHPARAESVPSAWRIFPLLGTRKGSATFGVGGVFD